MTADRASQQQPEVISEWRARMEKALRVNHEAETFPGHYSTLPTPEVPVPGRTDLSVVEYATRISINDF